MDLEKNGQGKIGLKAEKMSLKKNAAVEYMENKDKLVRACMCIKKDCLTIAGLALSRMGMMIMSETCLRAEHSMMVRLFYLPH